jgi:hypothetical protein
VVVREVLMLKVGKGELIYLDTDHRVESVIHHARPGDETVEIDKR